MKYRLIFCLMDVKNPLLPTSSVNCEFSFVAMYYACKHFIIFFQLLIQVDIYVVLYRQHDNNNKIPKYQSLINI